MADFDTTMSGGQIKTGSRYLSKRIAEYNKYLKIEAKVTRVRYG